MTDGVKDTYWATDDSVTTASFEIDLQGTHTVKYLVLQEYIPLGQRVKSFLISVEQNGIYEPVQDFTTIGYKRIIRFSNPIACERVKVTILDSKACPVISNVEVY